MDFWSVTIKSHYFIINWQLPLDEAKTLGLESGVREIRQKLHFFKFTTKVKEENSLLLDNLTQTK